MWYKKWMLKCLKVNIVIQKVDVEMSNGKYCETKSGCWNVSEGKYCETKSKVNIVKQKVHVEMSKGKYCETKSGCWNV